MAVVHGVGARDTYALTMLGLQARDKAVMLMFNTINTLINALHESGVKILEERNALSLIPNMVAMTYVTCKPVKKGACFTPFLIIKNKIFCLLFL